MIKSMLVIRAAGQRPHLFAKDVEKAVYTIFDEIEAALVRRDRVELRGFGAFFVKPRPARLRRNPKTGVAVSLPETLHPMFRTGKEMKARLNGTAGSALRAASTSRSTMRRSSRRRLRRRRRLGARLAQLQSGRPHRDPPQSGSPVTV